MPVKSAAQFKLMEGIAHGMKPKKKGIGPSPEVAKEMLSKTTHKSKSAFAKAKK
jgi:hypothetical protein